jgi:hypothetical protein
VIGTNEIYELGLDRNTKKKGCDDKKGGGDGGV